MQLMEHVVATFGCLQRHWRTACLVLSAREVAPPPPVWWTQERVMAGRLGLQTRLAAGVAVAARAAARAAVAAVATVGAVKTADQRAGGEAVACAAAACAVGRVAAVAGQAVRWSRPRMI